jgi:hypothetical protein
MKNFLLSIVVAGTWMNISEFIRNELLIKHIWVEGFAKIGLAFPSSPVNGAIWGLWALIFVTVLSLLTTKFNALASALISWVIGFVLLWLAMWNMGILPSGLLYWAVPWSFIEVFVAALICRRFLHSKSESI